jgi:hypothetical protein
MTATQTAKETGMNGKVEKIVVTINGKQFSRRTPRAYRFAIIGRMILETQAQQATGADSNRVERLRAHGYFDLHVLGWTQVDPSKMLAKFQKETVRRWDYTNPNRPKLVDAGLVYQDLAVVPVGGVFPAPEVK